MQIASVAPTTVASQSILRAANEQPHLAADLISKTVESLLQAQVVQTPVQSVPTVNGISSGSLIDINA
jgi:hypothetical protein